MKTNAFVLGLIRGTTGDGWPFTGTASSWQNAEVAKRVPGVYLRVFCPSYFKVSRFLLSLLFLQRAPQVSSLNPEARYPIEYWSQGNVKRGAPESQQCNPSEGADCRKILRADLRIAFVQGLGFNRVELGFRDEPCDLLFFNPSLHHLFEDPPQAA